MWFGMWWYVVVCGGMWWYVVVCGGMWWYVLKSVTHFLLQNIQELRQACQIDSSPLHI